MNPLFRYLLIIVLASCQADALHAADSEKCILYLHEPIENIDWQLQMLDGNAFFAGHQRGIRPEDNHDRAPYRASRVKLLTIEKDRTAKQLLFAPDGSYGGGYLTGDYTTDPPSVTLSTTPTKSSSWKLHPIEKKKGEYYIENINDQNKRAWFSIAATGLTVPVGPGPNYQKVSEFRRPVLSYEQKHSCIINVHDKNNTSK